MLASGSLASGQPRDPKAQSNSGPGGGGGQGCWQEGPVRFKLISRRRIISCDITTCDILRSLIDEDEGSAKRKTRAGTALGTRSHGMSSGPRPGGWRYGYG
jgi:hypothetical protein